MLKRIFFFFVIFNFAIILHSENRVITYNDCIRIALENNPQVSYILETEKIHFSNYKKATAAKSVEVTGLINTIQENDTESDTVGINGVNSDYSLFAGLSVSYGIFIPGRESSIEIAKNSIYLNKLLSKIQLNNLIYEVKQSYFNYIKAINNTKLRKTILDKYSLIYRKNTIYFEAGNLRPYLYNNIVIQYDQLRFDYEFAVQSEKNMRSALFLSMGISEPAEEFNVDGSLSLPELNLSYLQLEKISVVLSPEISIARLKKEVARKNVDLSSDKRLPTVIAKGLLGYKNSNVIDPNNMDDIQKRMEAENWESKLGVEFSMSFPLYTGGSINAEIEKSVAQYNQAQYDEKRVVLTVNQNLKSNFEKLSFLKKQIEISEKTLENSKRNFELAEKSYNAGIADITEVNTANENLLQVETQSYSIKIEYIMTIAAIANIIGISEDELCSK